MQDIISTPISSTISFWIAVGFLIYFSGNFFNIILTKLDLDPQIKSQMGWIYLVVTVSKNILICLALMGTEKNLNDDNDISQPLGIDLDKMDFTNN